MVYMHMVEMLVAHLASGIVNGYAMGNGTYLADLHMMPLIV
jgi:hypothetical protein